MCRKKKSTRREIRHEINANQENQLRPDGAQPIHAVGKLPYEQNALSGGYEWPFPIANGTRNDAKQNLPKDGEATLVRISMQGNGSV